MVTRNDISSAIRSLGVVPGDICLFHSSFKSLGPVEGGAESVIGGFEDVLGPEGTLVVPTLCQRDFDHVYENWHLDAPSDVGYLTNYFRKLPGALRSDQATHSVAARGKLAYELTKEHGAYGLRLCPYGMTAFADSSPWAKMYHRHAKTVFLGVTMRYNTVKHMLEGWYVEELLASIREDATQQELRAQLRSYENGRVGVWPYYNGLDMQYYLESLGLVTQTACGNATLYCVDMKEASDAALDAIRSDPQRWYEGENLTWIQTCKAAAQSSNNMCK